MTGRIKILIFCLIIFTVCIFGFLKFKEGKEVIETFDAKITQINGNSFLVSPLNGEDENNSSDLISFSISNLNIDVDDYSVGDIIQIQYNGQIMESYPAQIIPYKIKKVE